MDIKSLEAPVMTHYRIPIQCKKLWPDNPSLFLDLIRYRGKMQSD